MKAYLYLDSWLIFYLDKISPVSPPLTVNGDGVLQHSYSVCFAPCLVSLLQREHAS